MHVQLHSSLPQADSADWNFQSHEPIQTLRCESGSLTTTLCIAERIEQQWTDPLVALQWMADHPGPTPAHRWVGYLSYDLGRLFESQALQSRDDLRLPIFVFSLFQTTAQNIPQTAKIKGTDPVMAKIKGSVPISSLINEEKLKGTDPFVSEMGGWFPLILPSSQQAAEKLKGTDPVIAEIKGSVPFNSPTNEILGFRSPTALPHSSLTRAEYLAAVVKAIEYIRAGDVFQVNLSQRFIAPLLLDPRQVWQNLLHRTPAFYGAFLDCGDHLILSNSPELFLRVDVDRTVTTRPIKGTRPRAPGMGDDLLNSQKDQAELNMIIDLERNDLGRVCETGSVRVTQPRTIEAHPTVYHGVATVEGKLKSNVSFVDLLRATFPGGSITGAPKIRAMQVIDELEPVCRGPYCGAIGYLAADGSMQFNVAIRTIIVKDGRAHIPVGGGIVADSDPAAEYDETIVKAAAMFNALNLEDGRREG